MVSAQGIHTYVANTYKIGYKIFQVLIMQAT